MARTLEQWLAMLAKSRPCTPDDVRGALAVSRPGGGIVIAAAAKRIADERLETLAPELADAFTRLVGDAKVDSGCRGKIAIARALHELDCWEDAVFVRGLTIVQREGPLSPLTGEQDDTAAELRGICGLAHAHFARGNAHDVLAELLADRERITRVAAAQGLGDAGRRDATALLRYKLLVGDRDPEVLAACCESLLALAPDSGESAEFLVRLLAAYDDRAEAAALALGGGRVTAAYDQLVEWSTTCRPEQRHRVGYLALALLRSDQANAYLLDVIRTRSRPDAVAAARALATFKADPAIVQLLRDAASEVREPATRRELDTLLRSSER